MKKCAFTLAEILITLMIIGIVAALTIPSVITNYQQQEYKTGLKKAVSVINEAIQLNIAQDGEKPSQNASLASYLKKHMNIISSRMLISQGKQYIDSNRNIAYAYFNNDTFYTADGMRFEIPTSAGGNLYLHESGQDLFTLKEGYGPKTDEYGSTIPGSSLQYRIVNGGFCGSYGLSENPSGSTNTPCVVVVDVNGDKKPNPPVALKAPSGIYSNSGIYKEQTVQDPEAEYTYPSPSDKKLQDVFTIMVTDRRAIPFGVVAQRAMYSK